MAREFVPVRITNMRGVNLNQFQFDYDLTWAAFFMSAQGEIYGRYGGRDGETADGRLSLRGLSYAMRKALEAHRREGARTALSARFESVDELPGARRMKKDDCIHCHQVYDFRREKSQASGEWTLDRVWVYPPPENLGIRLSVDEGDLVSAVAAGTPAAEAGLRQGDRIITLNGLPVVSFADAQFALHRAPAVGEVPVRWKRGNEELAGILKLPEGWRKTDISWRGSMWGLEPALSLYGDDLTVEEKRALGLSADRLAFRQAKTAPKQARDAGIKPGDVIVGLNGEMFKMTMLQFNAHVRLNYKTGDRIVLDVLRNGTKLELPMVLSARTTF